MNSQWLQRLQGELDYSRQKHLLRERSTLSSAQGARVVIGTKEYLNFSGNDYLGMANNEQVRQAFAEAVKLYGVGAGASHLVVGHSEAHARLEQTIARWLGRDSALVFSSGYAANLGVLNALLSDKDFLLADKLNHASLVDGAVASGCRVRRYRHASVAHLRELLEKELSSCTGLGMLATDSVFSMDGDIADLPTLAQVARDSGLMLMVDDAHGLGVLGDTGGGSAEFFDLGQNDLPVLMGTFGKSLGVAGAFVAGSNELIQYLLQRARHYIYTTAMPPALAVAVDKSIELVRQQPERRVQLKQLIAKFQLGLETMNFISSLPDQIKSSTPVQPLIVGANETALQLSARLRDRGILAVAIRPPTVPVGTARLRISISAAHTESDIARLLKVLNEELDRLGLLQ